LSHQVTSLHTSP